MAGMPSSEGSSTEVGTSPGASSVFARAEATYKARCKTRVAAMDAEAGAAGSGDDRGGEEGAKGSLAPRSLPARTPLGEATSVEPEVPHVDR